MSFRYLSVCSGMEAASVAWEPLGFKAVGFSEIEPFPCAILKHRFPNTPNYGSLTEYQSWPIEQGSVDLLVGGTPCQSFSVAGLRKGLEDPRGNLALTFLGLADKLRPRWIVWENVPGVLSSSGGRDFASFLGALGQLGYGWAYRVLDAQYFGVPQRRRRVFVVATTSPGGGRLAGEVLSLPEGLRGYLETRKQKRKGAAADAGASAEADGKSVLWNGSDQPNAERLIDKAGTLNCNKGQRGGYICPAKPVVIDQDTVGTLCARDYKGVGNQYVQEGKCIPCEAPVPIQDGREIEKKQNGLGIGQPGDPAYTIDTTGAQAAGVVAIQGTIIGRGENAGPQGVGATEGGPMFTLTKTDIHGVAVPFRKAKRAQSTTDDESWVEGEALVSHPITYDMKQHHNPQPTDNVQLTTKNCAFIRGDTPLVSAMAVRRLTPVECERLQGFPDNWSRIPWKGKPEEDCPDGPRYKACGNSMAVPVMRWIGKRIAEVDAKLFQTK